MPSLRAVLLASAASASLLVQASAPLLTAQPPSLKDKPPSDLVWRFKEKDRFTTETTVNFTQARRAPNMPALQDVVQAVTVATFTVKKVEEDGSVSFEQRIDTAPKIRFDGANKLAAASLADLFVKLRGAAFRITLGPDQKVKSFEGYDELVKRIAQTEPPDALERFRTLVSEDDLKDASEEGFGFLPGRPVKVGDVWARSARLRLPLYGSVNATMEYKLQSVGTDGKARIQVSLKDSEFKPAGAAAQSRPDFSVESRTGTIVFDTKASRLVSLEMNLKMKGNVLTPHPQGVGMVPIDIVQQHSMKIIVKPAKEAR